MAGALILGCGRKEAKSCRLLFVSKLSDVVPKARFVAQPGMKGRGNGESSYPNAKGTAHFRRRTGAFANNLPCLWHCCFLSKPRPGISYRAGQ